MFWFSHSLLKLGMLKYDSTSIKRSVITEYMQLFYSYILICSLCSYHCISYCSCSRGKRPCQRWSRNGQYWLKKSWGDIITVCRQYNLCQGIVAYLIFVYLTSWLLWIACLKKLNDQKWNVVFRINFSKAKVTGFRKFAIFNMSQGLLFSLICLRF